MDPFDQGYRDYFDCYAEDECPYAKGTPECAEWYSGWHKANDRELSDYGGR